MQWSWYAWWEFKLSFGSNVMNNFKSSSVEITRFPRGHNTQGCQKKTLLEVWWGPWPETLVHFPVHAFNMPTAIQSQPLISSPHFTSPTSMLIFWVLPRCGAYKPFGQEPPFDYILKFKCFAFEPPFSKCINQASNRCPSHRIIMRL